MDVAYRGRQALEIKSDPFLLEIVRNHLSTTCKEMGVAMMRTSFSPVFNEALDFSCVLFDARREMIAQAPFCPAQIGSTVNAVPTVIAEIGEENIEPGDVLLMNDPFRSNCHLPEFVVIKPYFFDGIIRAYSANIAHMTDIGGSVPAAFGDQRNMFQEGIRFPPVKIYKNDQEVRDIFRILISNVRTPRQSYGDLKAMIGSLYLAEVRLDELLRRYGIETFEQCCEDTLAVSERLMRAEIARWPDGEYRAEAPMEDDGVTPDRQWVMRVTLVIRGDEIILDYTGTDPQQTGSGNMAFGTTASASYNGILQMVEGEIPYNGGCYRPISVIAPPGTMVNAAYPAATTGGNSDTHPTVVDMILRAFSQFSDRSSAADGGTCGLLGFGGVHPSTHEPYVFLNIEGIGYGARADQDGNDSLNAKVGNCANTPVEVMETRYPLLNVEYQLDVSQTGHGKHRGGFGTRRVLRMVADGVQITSHSNRHVVKGWGLFDGCDATNSRIAFRRRGEADWKRAREAFGTVSYGKFSDVVLNRGDEVMGVTPSGGGYGDPFERDPELVRRDVVDDELVDPETARDVYGVVIDMNTGTIDEKQTKEARKHRAGGVVCTKK